eukprot:TRINITY_DN9221_c0_g1_i3.p1 TRINITY_DN9221_c0_g1~~TRINITY_DN9221_c0_g1_i3.p1  ORF type:complete len:559 (-),score=115.22 TRINITY_DN9221_c0_g1_i3:468-2144(-)
MDFFFSSRRRHTRSCLVSWARRCVQETGIDSNFSSERQKILMLRSRNLGHLRKMQRKLKESEFKNNIVFDLNTDGGEPTQLEETDKVIDVVDSPDGLAMEVEQNIIQLPDGYRLVVLDEHQAYVCRENSHVIPIFGIGRVMGFDLRGNSTQLVRREIFSETHAPIKVENVTSHHLEDEEIEAFKGRALDSNDKDTIIGRIGQLLGAKAEDASLSQSLGALESGKMSFVFAIRAMDKNSASTTNEDYIINDEEETAYESNALTFGEEYEDIVTKILSTAFQSGGGALNKRIMIAGDKGTGKSILSLFLMNSLLSSRREYQSIVAREVILLDTDLGQPIQSFPGCVTLKRVSTPIFDNLHGRPHKVHETQDLCCFIGEFSPTNNVEGYLQAVEKALKHYESSYRSPLIINTHGYISNMGENLIYDMVKIVQPEHVIVISQLAKHTHMHLMENIYAGKFYRRLSLRKSANHTHNAFANQVETQGISLHELKTRAYKAYSSKKNKNRRDWIMSAYLQGSKASKKHVVFIQETRRLSRCKAKASSCSISRRQIGCSRCPRRIW